MTTGIRRERSLCFWLEVNTLREAMPRLAACRNMMCQRDNADSAAVPRGPEI